MSVSRSTRPLRTAVAAALTVAAAAALPAPAGANPAVAVDVVSTTNLTKLPATVTHRLLLTAGGRDELVRISAVGGGMEVGGSAVQVGERSAVSGAVTVCPGRWSAVHGAFTAHLQEELTVLVPAGTSGWIDLPIRLTAAPYPHEDLDATFSIAPAEGRAFTVRSAAPAWEGPTAPEMLLRVVPGTNRSSAVVGQAVGATGGRVEIWAIRPGRSRGRHVKTVRVADDGSWSWAGWRPRENGRWELYARYRRTPGSPRRGATQCGLPVRVR